MDEVKVNIVNTVTVAQYIENTEKQMQQYFDGLKIKQSHELYLLDSYSLGNRIRVAFVYKKKENRRLIFDIKWK